METQYINRISATLSLSVNQVKNVAQLHSEGSTVPFISRYRKEATGNMDEVQVNNVIEQIEYFEDLKKRKETVLKTIEAAGKLDDALRSRIENCYDTTTLEDIYLPYKPKRKTRALAAMEKGLEGLANLIFDQRCTDPSAEANAFLNAEVADINAALQGARDIIAERVAENEEARNLVRTAFDKEARLYSKVINGKKDTEEAQKFRDYFEWEEPLASCPSHRLLAIRRGEKEGFLSMDIRIETEPVVEGLKKIFIKAKSNCGEEMILAIEDAYDRLLKSSIENEYRLISKSGADEDAIKVFAENLKQLLLSSPLGSKRILALDPGFRSGCKLVCLDEQGGLVYNTNIYPHPPQQHIAESIGTLKDLVEKYNIEAIGIGNGTAGRETESLIRSIDFGRKINIYQVNESGASIYSASQVARDEFPDQDVTVRGAVSIGRRLLDPLSELVKIDAKS
ncbi:MAG: Tex-like N-terminal domain-containing protein, partial [Chitinophagaceae bacterium]